MNKLIKLGLSLLTGVALFFALSKDDSKSDIKSEAKDKFSNNVGDSGMNNDVIKDEASKVSSQERNISNASTSLKTAQGVFNLIVSAINTVLLILGNISKLTDTKPKSNCVFYT